VGRTAYIDAIPSELGAERLLTAREVAAILNVSVSHVYELTSQHKLPVIRVGRLVRYNRNAILGDA
jgi:excisionase family DNA binding protein